MAAAQQLANLFVGQMIHHLEQFGIFAEEMLADVAAGLDGILLVIAVDGFFHALEQQAVLSSLRSSSSQSRAPDHLDDIPAGAAEKRFEFLNDLAVAAHWAIEPLQIAIDDPNQIVEILARRQRDRAERFRLVRFAVAEKRPDFRLFAADQIRAPSGND